MEFDYLIIDEAQNIKNPDSIITKAIKTVNARVKFALTGTPVENNLMELWSIFDFVMPGYLYNKHKFEKIFANNEKNYSQLKNLIKPFMLRRTKKEVIDELPEKIEQKFYVELEKEHKRAYRSFVNLIKRRILENNEDNMIESFAKKQLGKRYVWATQGPSTFDCSGFTYYVVKKTTGKTIPRGSTVQGKHGKYVSRKNLKKGDLVFFATTGKGRISHAGIYLGNKKFIHASSSKGKVVISSMASGHYYKTFVNGRRVI